MKPEYDFSKGERGKFFRPNAELHLPIYLDADVHALLAERAAQKGVPPGEMVSALLKQEIVKAGNPDHRINEIINEIEARCRAAVRLSRYS